jgi:hypothetical protein
MALDLNRPPHIRNAVTNEAKLNIIDYVPGNSSRDKICHMPVKGARPTHGQHISFVLVFILFYFVRFLSPRPATSTRTILTIYTSNDEVSRKEVPFEDSNACKNLKRVHFPQNKGPNLAYCRMTVFTIWMN